MKPILMVILCALVSALGSARDVQVASVPYVPVEMRVHVPPVAIGGNGMTNLVYELHLTNYRRSSVGLLEIEIFGDDGLSLKKYGLDDLKRCVRFRSMPSESTGELEMGAGSTAVIFIMLAFDEGAEVPESLSHVLTVNLGAPGEEQRLVKSEGAAVRIGEGKPVVLGPPLRPGVWLAGNCTGDGPVGHRDSLQVWNGRLVITQRYAIDFMKLGDDMRLVHDDQALNSNWYCYGEELLAVADGVVADTIDGVIENTPVSGGYAVASKLETAAGNCVVLDIGEGRYAVYAHLKPGGVLVKAGDKVKKGQVIGLIGNSGISDAPHLHFHVGDSKSIFGGEGLPFVFEQFEYLGQFDLAEDESLTTAWSGTTETTIRVEEIPIGDVVISFQEFK